MSIENLGTSRGVMGEPDSLRTDSVALYGADFAADPHAAYRWMRARYGAMAPVELAPGVPATLVIGHRAAVSVLHDPARFPADPRGWQDRVPLDCPVRPMLEWRPISCKNSGDEFLRYRGAIVAGLDGVDLHALRAFAERAAAATIDGFRDAGHAELIGQYLLPTLSAITNHLLGCPPELGDQVADGIAAVMNGAAPGDTNEILGSLFLGLVRYKREHPGPDLTSRLLSHPSRLTDIEAVNHIWTLYAAGTEFELNLIANTLLLVLTDERFGDQVLSGSMSSRDALDELLFNDPPVANVMSTFPPQATLLDNVWLPAHQPVLISLAACNNDPKIRAGDLTGNRSHLAWGTGPHMCPATSMAYLLAASLIDQLLDELPELRSGFTDDGPVWRPGPFHRALTGLPVMF